MNWRPGGSEQDGSCCVSIFLVSSWRQQLPQGLVFFPPFPSSGGWMDADGVFLTLLVTKGTRSLVVCFLSTIPNDRVRHGPSLP